MLPYPALTCIAQNMDSWSMGLFMNFARVNRSFRRAFLSDELWARFDVHAVAGTDQVYTYEGYVLHGIAAHFFNYLTSIDQRRRSWYVYLEPCSTIAVKKEYEEVFGYYGRCAEYFLFAHLALPSAYPWWMRFWDPRPFEDTRRSRHIRELESLDQLYDQMNLLCAFDSPIKVQLAGFPSCYKVSDPVWRLYIKFPSRAKWIDYIPIDSLPNSKEGTLYWLDHCPEPLSWQTELNFRGDRDVSLKLAEIGYIYDCAPEFHEDPDFMLEAVRLLHWNFGATKLAREPWFLEKVLREIPGLLEFVEKNYWDFPKFFRRRRVLDNSAPPDIDFFRLEMFPQWVRDRPSFKIATECHTIYRLCFAQRKELCGNQRALLIGLAKRDEYGLTEWYYASEKLRDNKKFVLKAVTVNPEAIKSVSARLSKDPEVLARGRAYGLNPQPWSGLALRVQHLEQSDVYDAYERFRRIKEAETTAVGNMPT